MSNVWPMFGISAT